MSVSWYILVAEIPLLLFTAFSDVATRIIPNCLCLAIAIIGIVSRSFLGISLALTSIGIASLLFVLLFMLWTFSIIGGGDIKLIAALALGLSLKSLGIFIFAMAFTGLIVALIHIWMRCLPKPSRAPSGANLLHRVYAVERWRIFNHGSVPYGVAIASGGIYVIPCRSFLKMNMAAVAMNNDVAPVVSRRIVAFVNDDVSESALTTGLIGSVETLDVRRGNIRQATRLLENDTEMLAIIADISDVDDPLTALESLSRVCPRATKVALIGDSTDINFYRTLLDMGVSEYLSKPITRDTVQMLLRPKLLGDEAPVNDRGGHVVTVCGAQGGAGATSIAINLAMQIADTTKAKVALLDLHLQGGETAVMLGVQPGTGLRVALEDPMRADNLFLERAAIQVNERVRLIAGDEPLDAELQITESGVRHVLGLLRNQFNFIIVDMPVPLPPAMHSVIALSRHVLVLLEAEITGLRNTHALRDMVSNITDKNRMFTVLNRANRAGGLSAAQIVHGLGGPPDFTIPDLGKRMVEAVNEGKPAFQRLPALRRSLKPLVREIAGIEERRMPWFNRMFVR